MAVHAFEKPEIQRVVIDPHADQQKVIAVCLAKAITTAWGGSVQANLFVPRETFDFFNRIESRQRHHHNSAGDPVWFKAVDVPGIPFIRVNLSTIEAPK